MSYLSYLHLKVPHFNFLHLKINILLKGRVLDLDMKAIQNLISAKHAWNSEFHYFSSRSSAVVKISPQYERIKKMLLCLIDAVNFDLGSTQLLETPQCMLHYSTFRRLSYRKHARIMTDSQWCKISLCTVPLSTFPLYSNAHYCCCCCCNNGIHSFKHEIWHRGFKLFSCPELEL